MPGILLDFPEFFWGNQGPHCYWAQVKAYVVSELASVQISSGSPLIPSSQIIGTWVGSAIVVGPCLDVVLACCLGIWWEDSHSVSGSPPLSSAVLWTPWVLLRERYVGIETCKSSLLYWKVRRCWWSGWIGIWRQASFSSIFTIHSCGCKRFGSRPEVIIISNHNRLQSITGFLVIIIAIAILVLKCHVIAIAIEYIAKVITISDYLWSVHL